MTAHPELLHDPDAALPPPFVIVRLFLDDGTVETGAWTGKRWWMRGSEVQPWRWQSIRRDRNESMERQPRLSAA